MATNLGISISALKHWMVVAGKNEGTVPTRGSRNYNSDEVKENCYGAPKITHKLREESETSTEKTVDIYMQQMGLQAQWVKHHTRTTINLDFRSK